MRHTIEQRLLARTEEASEVTSPHVDTPCWNCSYSIMGQRYPQISIDGGKGYAHRVAYQLWKGGIPKGLCVLHACDNPLCVSPEHLFLGTDKDNVLDCMRKGRNSRGNSHSIIMRQVSVKGERHGMAKLTEQEVRDIRDYKYQGCRAKDVAIFLSIPLSRLNNVWNGRSWKSVL